MREPIYHMEVALGSETQRLTDPVVVHGTRDEISDFSIMFPPTSQTVVVSHAHVSVFPGLPTCDVCRGEFLRSSVRAARGEEIALATAEDVLMGLDAPMALGPGVSGSLKGKIVGFRDFEEI